MRLTRHERKIRKRLRSWGFKMSGPRGWYALSRLKHERALGRQDMTPAHLTIIGLQHYDGRPWR